MTVQRSSRGTPIIAIAGWKNSGKTTLTVRLVEEFTKCGLRIATVKHAHHSFDIDHEGRDSFRHRKAGATEVAVVSKGRWALIHELRDIGVVEIRTLHDFRIQQLQCNVVTRERVQGQINRARRTLAENFPELEFSNLLHDGSIAATL